MVILEMCFGQEIVAAFMKDQSYAERTRELRENLALDGMWLPVVRFRDDITLDGKEFMILAWQNVTGKLLRPCIRGTEASPRFHARYNATGKTYRYTCFWGRVKPVFDRKYYTPLEEMPDLPSIITAAIVLNQKSVIFHLFP